MPAHSTRRLVATASTPVPSSARLFSLCRSRRPPRCCVYPVRPSTHARRNNNFTGNHGRGRQGYPPGVIVLNHQHHRNRHHHFIGHRVKKSAETGALIPAAGQITIKPVGNGSDKRSGRRQRGPDERQIKRQHKERYQDDAKQSKQCRDIKLHSDR